MLETLLDREALQGSRRDEPHEPRECLYTLERRWRNGRRAGARQLHDGREGSPGDQHSPDALHCGSDIDVFEDEGRVDELHGREAEVVFLNVADVELKPRNAALVPRAASPDSPYLFTTYTRRGKPRDYEYKTEVNWLRSAGIVAADFHAHAARREYISNALEHGTPHTDVMKQVGQKSIAALLMYDQSRATHPEVRKRLEAGDKLRTGESDEGLAEYLGISADEVRRLRETKKAKEVQLRSMLKNAAGETASVAAPKRRPGKRTYANRRSVITTYEKKPQLRAVK